MLYQLSDNKKSSAIVESQLSDPAKYKQRPDFPKTTIISPKVHRWSYPDLIDFMEKNK